jgi:hypothetical protein
MPKYVAGVGDRVEVGKHHRLAGSEGVVVAVGDNPSSSRPLDNLHVRFDRVTWGAIHQREIWLDRNDIVVLEKAPDGYIPPDDLEQPGADGDD